jgi:undecaprenyl-diphosphatase
MTLIQTLILSLIEGMTEFLPVSSTGHMILASSVMKIEESEFLKTFLIFIQLGAILAIALMYVKRFLKGIDIYIKLLVAFIPTAVVGFFAYEFIRGVLFTPIVVSTSLIVGGIILIIIDKRVENNKSSVDVLENIPLKNAFFIGLMQCLSMIPGTSRSAATIIGGTLNKLDKKQATEFSFLLAIPTMFAATGYDLMKTSIEFSQEELTLLLIGLLVSFVTAWFAVKLFLKIIKKFGFIHFGYYRIVVGVVYLLVMN